MKKKKDEKIHELKVILVGNSGVGKTNLINVLTGRKFEQSIMTTTISTFVEKKMEMGNKKYNLEIWDTAGQEKFHSLTKLFIKESRIVLFIYDITDKNSFTEIKSWVKIVKEVLEIYKSNKFKGKQAIEIVKEVLDDKFVMGLAGNKKDLFLKEVINEVKGKEKAKEIGAIFKLTSAKEGEGIHELMESLLKEYIKRLNAGEFQDLDTSSKLDIKKAKKKRKCC